MRGCNQMLTAVAIKLFQDGEYFSVMQQGGVVWAVLVAGFLFLAAATWGGGAYNDNTLIKSVLNPFFGDDVYKYSKLWSSSKSHYLKTVKIVGTTDYS